MKGFLYSSKMLYILAALLVLAFFLPDMIGAVPSIIIGGIIIGFAVYVYNLWSTPADESGDDPDDSSS